VANPLPWLITCSCRLCMTALIGLAIWRQSAPRKAMGRIVDEDKSVLPFSARLGQSKQGGEQFRGVLEREEAEFK